jgi:hypothetical protein
VAYIFIAHQVVPQSVIKAIEKDIKNEFTKQLTQYKGMGDDWVEMLLKDFDIALQNVADKNFKSADGYRLKQSSALEIANFLKNGKKIEAIKEFRLATGEGLRESKHFIDKFQTGDQGYIDFLNAFL